MAASLRSTRSEAKAVLPNRTGRIGYRLSRCILTVNAREGIHFGGRDSETSVVVLQPASRSATEVRRRRGRIAVWVTKPTAAQISEIVPSRNPSRLSSPEWMRRYRIARSVQNRIPKRFGLDPIRDIQ